MHPDTITQLQIDAGEPARRRTRQCLLRGQGSDLRAGPQVFAANPTIIENVPCSAYPTSLRVTLNDTSQYQQITASLGCEPDDTGQMSCAEPGVREVVDYRAILDRLSAITTTLSVGLFALAVVMLISAVVLVANTLQMGMFARRKEISIMRLVGATNWRIRVPFLIEAGSRRWSGRGWPSCSCSSGRSSWSTNWRAS